MLEELPRSFTVPLFPLPGVVLFPGAVLPLHIFEERYREMLADALRGDKLIAMAQVKPVPAIEALLGRPAILEVLGVGTIVTHNALPDGRSNIALLGLGRARVELELPPERTYRIAKVERLDDRAAIAPSDQTERNEAKAELLSTAELLMRRLLNKDAYEQIGEALKDREACGAAADFLASVFVQDPAVRQALLEDLDPTHRAQRVRKLLQQQASKLEPAPPRYTGRPEDLTNPN